MRPTTALLLVKLGLKQAKSTGARRPGLSVSAAARPARSGRGDRRFVHVAGGDSSRPSWSAVDQSVRALASVIGSYVVSWTDSMARKKTCRQGFQSSSRKTSRRPVVTTCAGESIRRCTKVRQAHAQNFELLRGMLVPPSATDGSTRATHRDRFHASVAITESRVSPVRHQVAAACVARSRPTSAHRSCAPGCSVRLRARRRARSDAQGWPCRRESGARHAADSARPVPDDPSHNDRCGTPPCTRSGGIELATSSRQRCWLQYSRSMTMSSHASRRHARGDVWTV